MEKILTIEKVNFIGKWVEFWFDEEKKYTDVLDDNYKPTGEEEEIWSECSKAYILWNAVEKSKLTDDVHNNGFVGKKLKWFFDSPNWEIVGFI